MSKVDLVIGDVDGTLVTKDKVLTTRAIAAASRLRDAGIAFAITSGRPPLGMRMLIQPLGITTPIAAFNGGMYVRPDLSVIEQFVLPEEVSRLAATRVDSCGLDVWIYRGTDWFVRQRHGPHVDREEWTVKLAPTVVAGFEGLLDNVVKIVGVSDDLDAVARCAVEVQREFDGHASARRSQPYYLDITHPRANKGEVAVHLSEYLGIPLDRIASIGDMPSDVPMFERTGFSIAMGQANTEVKAAARFVTASSEEEGFAYAIEHCILA